MPGLGILQTCTRTIISIITLQTAEEMEHKYENISFTQKYLTPRSYSGKNLNIFEYLKEIVQERDCLIAPIRRSCIADWIKVDGHPWVEFRYQTLTQKLKIAFFTAQNLNYS